MGCSSSQEKVLIQSLTDEKAQLVSLNTSLLSQLNSLPSCNLEESTELKSLRDEISKLSQQINNLKLSQKSCLLRSLSRCYQKALIESLSFTFQYWHSYSLLQKDENFSLEPPILEQYDEETLKKASKILSEDFNRLINSSPVWELYIKNQDAKVAQMSTQKILKLFEEMMDLKHAQDLRDLQERRKPKSVPEFFIDFLNRSFGLKHLALKSLNQIMPALVSVNCPGFLELFCRLLQIKNNQPAGFTISLFLAKIRVEFNALVNKTAGKVGKSGKGNLNSQNLGKVEGGVAFLSDVFVLVYSLFDKNRAARSLFIQFLQPESISAQEYFLFHVCFKMARMPISSEELFDLINSKKQNYLQINTLVNGMSRVLDLGLNTETLKIIIDILDSQNSGRVSKETFTLKLNQKTYLKNVNSEKFTISKFKFLACALDIYNKLKEQNLAVFLYKLKDFDQEFSEFYEFKSVIKIFEEGLCEEFLEFLFEEVGNEGFNKEGLAKVLVEYAVGSKEMKTFSKFYVVISGMSAGFDKRRSEVIEGLLEECKSMAKFVNY